MEQFSIKKTNPFNAWWLAIRPRTLPAAIAGVITGTAAALARGHFRFLPALAALLVALFLQIGSNLANDVLDFEKGADSGERLGPTRVTQSGLLSPRNVKLGTIIVFLLASLCGLYLAFVSRWEVIPVGLLAILAAVAYTGGPYPLGYHGLGELFVFLFFGVVSVVGTYYVQAKSFSLQAWLMSIPVGLIIVGILVVNNLRDIDADRAAGKNTLAVRFGSTFAKWEYGICLFFPYLLILLFCLVHILPWFSLLTFLTFPITLQTSKIVFSTKGKALNKALGNTGLIAFLFSLLYLFAVLLPG